VVRRIPDLNPSSKDGQETLFDTWRFHAFFTTTDPEVADTVAADKTHRGHAIIEQVHADLKSSALAHLPSGVFTANAAWLVLAVMAFNLTRAAATISGPALAKATTATIRRKLINVPASVASSARRVTLHLPTRWPWETAWTQLFAHGSGPPLTPRPPDHPADTGTTRNRGTPGSEAGRSPTPRPAATTLNATDDSEPAHRWIEA
jgi:Transposase DDE domain group 1